MTSKRIPTIFYILFTAIAASVLVSIPVVAKTTAYLPLKQSRSIERKVDQLLLLANMTSVKRPIAIHQVETALSKVCATATTALCQEIKHYLVRFKGSGNVVNAKLALQISDRENAALANQRGTQYDADYFGHISAFGQISDYVSYSLGAQFDGDSFDPENTYLSMGTDWLQVDIGTKPHWFSPMEHSAMLISTHAKTIPTLSFSNSEPLTDLQLRYELFVGEMSNSDVIFYDGTLISGKPILTGIHLSISPWQGFTLGVNRLMQSGGGDRGGNSIGDLIGAFFDPTGRDNTSDELSVDEQFGNQAASLVSQFTFQGPVPVAVYFEYAGEDTSRGFNYKLGNSSLSAGIYVPMLTANTGLRLEVSEWQNGWYVHHVYKDGLTNQGHIIGHWAAELRNRDSNFAGDGVGAYNFLAKVYWQASAQDDLTISANITQNEDYTAYEYDTSYKLKVAWLRSLETYDIESTIELGTDVFDESYFAISTSLNW